MEGRGGRERETEREGERQRDRDRETETERDRERQRETERSKARRFAAVAGSKSIGDLRVWKRIVVCGIPKVEGLCLTLFLC